MNGPDAAPGQLHHIDQPVSGPGVVSAQIAAFIAKLDEWAAWTTSADPLEVRVADIARWAKLVCANPQGGIPSQRAAVLTRDEVAFMLALLGGHGGGARIERLMADLRAIRIDRDQGGAGLRDLLYPGWREAAMPAPGARYGPDPSADAKRKALLERCAHVAAPSVVPPQEPDDTALLHRDSLADRARVALAWFQARGVIGPYLTLGMLTTRALVAGTGADEGREWTEFVYHGGQVARLYRDSEPVEWTEHAPDVHDAETLDRLWQLIGEIDPAVHRVDFGYNHLDMRSGMVRAVRDVAEPPGGHLRVQRQRCPKPHPLTDWCPPSVAVVETLEMLRREHEERDIATARAEVRK